jgi:hypothetical protein
LEYSSSVLADITDRPPAVAADITDPAPALAPPKLRPPELLPVFAVAAVPIVPIVPLTTYSQKSQSQMSSKTSNSMKSETRSQMYNFMMHIIIYIVVWEYIESCYIIYRFCFRIISLNLKCFGVPVVFPEALLITEPAREAAREDELVVSCREEESDLP